MGSLLQGGTDVTGLSRPAHVEFCVPEGNKLPDGPLAKIKLVQEKHRRLFEFEMQENSLCKDELDFKELALADTVSI